MAGYQMNRKAGDKKPRPAKQPEQPRFKITQADLETVCGITSKFPQNDCAEFAFAGKSNVGKSSLINALMQRKALARTSATPGKTQTINYYKLSVLRETDGEKRTLAFYLVDLPGYGFTKISPEVKAKWGKMVERYLAQTRQLRKVFLLVDMRHKPTEDDCMMYDWVVHNGFTPVVVATKQDKLKKSEQDKAVKLIRQTLGMQPEDKLIPFSAETKQGREALYQLLEETLDEAVAE